MTVRLGEIAAKLSGPQSPVAGTTQAQVMRTIAQYRGRLSRREIAQRVGLSSGTLTKAVGPLTTHKFVEQGAPLPDGPGRPSVPLHWGHTYAAIGVRIVDRDDQPAAAIVTATYLDGEPLPGADKADRHLVTREPGATQFTVLVDEIVQMIEQLVSRLAASQPDVIVLGCGVAMGGHIDHGVIRMSYDTGWGAPRAERSHFALRDQLAARLPFDVVLDNDVTSLAVQELLTSDRANTYGVGCVLRDGVGAALVLDGNMWRGPHGLGGEGGHLQADGVVLGAASSKAKKLPLCRCGQEGHVEAFAAPQAIARRANVGDFDELAATKTHDPEIQELFHQGGRALGRMLQATILNVDPEQILLFLPPPLAVTNAAFPGAHYRRGLFEEVQTTFSTGGATWIDPVGETETEIEERGATAAAMLVLGRLIDRVEAGDYDPEK